MRALLLLIISTAVAIGEPQRGGTSPPPYNPATQLFDGKSLDGWSIQEGEEQWWKVENGSIIGGSLEKPIPHNTFISLPKHYGNFELRLQVKVEGNKPNAGIQIRSERIPNHHEMIGYQADVGIGYWGKLYDESRRKKVIGDYVSEESAKAVKDGWNDYRIRCEGPRIRLWLNDILTVDYTEEEKDIPLIGLIALQAHSGKPYLVHYKDIEIEELK
jgi:hypothetical protein